MPKALEKENITLKQRRRQGFPEAGQKQNGREDVHVEASFQNGQKKDGF